MLQLTLSRNYTLSIVSRCKIILYVAPWTTTNLNHWRTLLKARAIENCICVIACNSVGDVNNENHIGNTYTGYSMAIDPN
ncbi:nitrilase-related carbon-nitrogen hydrolase [Bacillus wiedmannii]|uniref:nitrilase-related carbon-nitrogen hydrolase n=2 Tax=Bacillaceae TaxID=186817 RepID=UPI00211D4959|nr:nitrilase-related carbon-nitrogen hydrolase [Bacillus wiedmannii]